MDPVRVEIDYNNRGLRTETRRYADAIGTTLISRSTQDFDENRRLTALDHLDSIGGIIAGRLRHNG